jgi:hypothetical protein
MTGLLSSISGQFGKMVVLGTLFPVLIVSVLNIVIVAPVVPFAAELQTQLKRVAIGEDKWTAVVLVFVVLVLTGFLYNLNISIIRLYEGYPWQDSWIGRLLAWRHKRRLREATSLRTAIRYLRRELAKRDANDPVRTSLQSRQTALAVFVNSELPDAEDFVLPTRLGNVIRCFERYSYIAYGMDAIVFWPRLIARIDSAFASSLDSAKASIDFMLNFSFLSALSCLGIVVIEVSTETSTAPSIWRAGLFLALAVIFYYLSIGRAAAWGMEVKSAFDLYRFDLLKALGYQQQPSTFFEEQALWQRISVQLLYSDSRDRPLPYKAAPTRVIASPAGVRLDIKRTLAVGPMSGQIAVEIQVDNKDTRPASAVTLVDTLPDGYRCILQSASVSQGTLRVSNLNPVELVLDPIAPNRAVTVKYMTKPATS